MILLYAHNIHYDTYAYKLSCGLVVLHQFLQSSTIPEIALSGRMLWILATGIVMPAGEYLILQRRLGMDCYSVVAAST